VWITIGLVSAICFAAVHIVDEYCVEEILDKPHIGVITSALASVSVFLAIPFILPAIGQVESPTSTNILLCLLVGTLIQTNQALYFKALSYSEAGTIASYWNMVPALLPMISYIVFGKVLQTDHYQGIYLIVLASLSLCLLDTKSSGNFIALFLIMSGVLLQVIAFLLMEVIFNTTHFYAGFLLITIGMILAGLSPLILKKTRNTFLSNWKRIAESIHIFIGIEIINLIAYGALQRSIQLSNDASLVAAIDATAPGFAFLMSLFLLYQKKKRSAVNLGTSKITLSLRFINVGIMILGVWMISQSQPAILQ
jgi:uncharacterized membrane protein